MHSGGGHMRGRVSTHTTIEKMELWRIAGLCISSAVIGAGAGANIIFYYHLNEIIGIVAGAIIAYAQMYFFLEMYKIYRIYEKKKEQ